MNVPNLRSPYDQVGGLYHFGRMLDKIRLYHAGNLPTDYTANLGGAMALYKAAFQHAGGAGEEAQLVVDHPGGVALKTQRVIVLFAPISRKRDRLDECEHQLEIGRAHV